MRLSPAQTDVILSCVHQQYGADARVMLFGSRLDDSARGGDVGLLVETAGPPTLHQRALATMAPEQALNLPVGILAQQRGTHGGAFARNVRNVRGKVQPLEAWAAAPVLRALSLFEKLHVIESVESWQLCRTARNLAAHDYETSYELIAEHFNEVQALEPVLVNAASRLLQICLQSLGVCPATADFDAAFTRVCHDIGT